MKRLVKTILPEPEPRKGEARREPDVQLMPILKKPQQIRDFEEKRR